MDPRLHVTREEFNDVQMELKRVHNTQQQQSERIRLLEKRQADDAALKAVWNSPFPSALGGTPQHGQPSPPPRVADGSPADYFQGPVHVPQNDVFSDDLDDHTQNLLGSLHLEAEDEPTRRGAASRANSVRFDESALHGAGWGAHSGRHSGDFGPIRPSSGMGGHQLMERSLSHKSDGRHSSAGHSVHSMHSGISGRASSLGLDTNFVIGGHDDDSPLDIPEPPPGLLVMGSAPSIIRCWLTTNYTSSSLLYAVVCTGSPKSTVEFSLIKALELSNNIHRGLDGVRRITLPVFLAEARVTQSNSRSASPAPQLPYITCSFEVTGMEQPDPPGASKSIRVFIGSHTLRLHSADLLLSQNSMTLYGSDRDKLLVPFVRPEDDAVFKNLTTANMLPEKPRLNAAAREFVAGEKSAKPLSSDGEQPVQAEAKSGDQESEELVSPESRSGGTGRGAATSTASESGGENEKQSREAATPEVVSAKEGTAPSDGSRREPSAAIRTPWRQTAMGSGPDSGSRENTPLSGYQPATRVRNMKVLRPTKSGGSSSAKTGAAYEPPPPSGEHRRRGQVESAQQSSNSSASSWGNLQRSISVSTSSTLGGFGGLGEDKLHSPLAIQGEGGKQSAVPRSANNPLGSASAFSWIASSKPKAPTAAAE